MIHFDEELQKLNAEYEELNEKLSNPSGLTNSNDFQLFSSRLAQLTPIVEKIREYNRYKKSIEDSKLMIQEESDKELIEMAKTEITESEELLSKRESEIKELLFEADPNDVRNAILEIRAGTGGDEAALFAGDLYRMYIRFCEQMDWKIVQISSNKTGNGGYKEVIAIISGANVYGKLKLENGVHRVQRIPTTESAGRIHTSAVSVVVLPEIDDIDIDIKEEDLRIDVYRAGGPGGQSVNTTDSAVRITHIPTDTVVSCQDEKSQHKNKARAMSILKSKLYELEQEKKDAEQADIRQSAIRGGDRSAKIRTYNYPQSRITDHRIKKSWYNLTGILDGDLEEVIKSTQKELSELNF